MRFDAYAKINWDLHIHGKRPDGYHEIDTVMVNVSLSDKLEIEPAPAFEFRCSDSSLPTDDSNLVVKAAKALAQAAGRAPACRIYLEKQIPAGGGMGGGSSDAACTLKALNQLWDLKFSVERLAEIAATLGSDVPFFLYGGWCLCQGRGEIIHPLRPHKKWCNIPLALLLPELHVSTPAVYRNLKAPALSSNVSRSDLTKIISRLEMSTRTYTLCANFGLANDLMEPALQVEPKLVPLQAWLEAQYSGRWLMSGSGAVHFVVLRSLDEAASLRQALSEAVGQKIRVLTATTLTP